MRKTSRIIAAAAACLAGATAITMIMWPDWPGYTASLLPWDDDGWRAMLVSAGGKAVPLPGRGMLLFAVTVLLAITLLATSLGVIVQHIEVPGAAPAPPRNPEFDQQVSSEVAKLLQLVRSQLEASGNFSIALTKISEQLPGVATPDQMKMIVSYLVIENDNMRKKSANLQSNLEASRKLIDQLRVNLAVAKVEVLSDSLTGVKNRRAFDLALATELAEARGSGKPLCLIMADIDHFKQVNDRFGHQTGDEVLRGFAQALSRNVKGRDCVARYGGEEFAIILPETTAEDALALAQRINAEIESRDMTIAAQRPVRITASFGVAQWTGSESSDTFLKRGDAKLYEAKSLGRNRVAA
jgi:diguanylate cyclase